MAERDRDAEFTEYVSARSPWLRRVAYLLCGDWHRADDIVQSSITKLYVHWGKASRADNIDGYARTVLVNTFLAEQRTNWASRTVLHRGVGGDGEGEEIALAGPDSDLSLDLKAALARLPPRQRATVVLRFYCDQSVEQTAQLMGCSTGNVKSQSARGLTALRRLVDPALVPALEGN